MVAPAAGVKPKPIQALEPLLVVLLGPTASGKTALSLQLAEKLSGEIVSCDSVAVFREMEIGTAKPSRNERQRVPHHLIDVRNPDEPYTAGDYGREAREALSGISGRGRVPIVTGGTGLYLRALLDGLFAGPARSDTLRARLRAKEERHGAGTLHRLLAKLDPIAAAQMHANDLPKIIRALEVPLLTRRTMTDAWKDGRDPLIGYRILRIGLEPPRARLYERINLRAAAMFDDGLVEETQMLVERYGYECRPLQSLGYAQAMAVLRSEMSRDEAIVSAQQGHRNYAKRQLTWFRRELEVQWLKGCGDDAEIAEAALKLAQSQFKTKRPRHR
ncbi:MAG: tRNA (adenosine(37)-N6)-dimethylallyltransferase MiaA [Acidobacteriaceae bacterium]|nr:tRNA (adenosine(37)-N6)-dimethylallyltransferase MiaA [Acidobacteriaceae bacterium]